MAPADPVRQQVEAALHRFVTSATSAPCDLVRGAARAVEESVGLVRTMVNLTVDGLLGWDANSGVPPLESVGGDLSGATPFVTAVARRPSTLPASDGPIELPIDGYEDLAASHIVARLDRLTPAELGAIRSFEVANRGRRTVVGKIDQLLART